MASILNGKQVAAELIGKIKEETQQLIQQGRALPGLAVVLVGDDPASTIYVNNKRKACLEVGFNSFAYNLPLHTSENELTALIDELNAANDVHGILVQLPLPAHINTAKIIERISPLKDIDGFHPYNLGRLAQGEPLLRPCTPYGIIQLLKNYHLNLVGLNAVVVGTSNIVGRPMALELLLEKATVTSCHRATKNLEHHIRSADLIIVAAGVLDVVKTHWLNSKQILVDVGIHRTKEGKIRGDIDYLIAQNRVQWITPVPGGVGPMTICTLLQNTLLSAKLLTS
jgi:methylenetetrahydrofolate dehydrogenase (NADP+)/methenyltetrahydrofolate cyclohydrolase